MRARKKTEGVDRSNIWGGGTNHTVVAGTSSWYLKGDCKFGRVCFFGRGGLFGCVLVDYIVRYFVGWRGEITPFIIAYAQ